MIRLFILLPLFMSAIWWWYLNSRGLTIKDGIRGFAYIVGFNLIIIAFFIMMIFNETLKIRLKIFQHEDLIFI